MNLFDLFRRKPTPTANINSSPLEMFRDNRKPSYAEMRETLDARAETIEDLQWDALGYRAALHDIKAQGMTSKSGTARAMARKAAEALR